MLFVLDGIAYRIDGTGSTNRNAPGNAHFEDYVVATSPATGARRDVYAKDLARVLTYA
jgi:hypothetical protein